MWQGLVRVCLPKRTHQPILCTLLNFPSSTTPQKDVRSLLQSGNCPRALSVSASTVRLGQNRIGGVLVSRTVRASGGIICLRVSRVNKKVPLFRCITKCSGSPRRLATLAKTPLFKTPVGKKPIEIVISAYKEARKNGDIPRRYLSVENGRFFVVLRQLRRA
jgi:hypothetical protein